MSPVESVLRFRKVFNARSASQPVSPVKLATTLVPLSTSSCSSSLRHKSQQKRKKPPDGGFFSECTLQVSVIGFPEAHRPHDESSRTVLPFL